MLRVSTACLAIMAGLARKAAVRPGRVEIAGESVTGWCWAGGSAAMKAVGGPGRCSSPPLDGKTLDEAVELVEAAFEEARRPSEGAR